MKQDKVTFRQDQGTGLATSASEDSSQSQYWKSKVIGKAKLKSQYEQKGRSMIQRKLRAVYVNPQQIQRQREHADKAKKLIVSGTDPAILLAKAWGVRKLPSS